MRNFSFVITISTLFALNANAQITSDSTTKKQSLPNQPNKADLTLIDNTGKASPRRTGSPETWAKEDIKKLKKGILLVRLRTSENSINQLKTSGNAAKATEVERQQNADNKKLMAAFKEHYKFSSVYFFYSSESEKVKAGELRGIVFDANQKPVPETALTGKEFYVAELTDIQQPEGEKADPGQGNITSMTFKALVMRDKNMDQLSNPFPFYVKRIQNIPPHTRTEAEMVTLLNKKLETFYSSQYGGKK